MATETTKFSLVVKEICDAIRLADGCAVCELCEGSCKDLDAIAADRVELAMTDEPVTDPTSTARAPYPQSPDYACPDMIKTKIKNKLCWSRSFCTIYGCQSHPSNTERVQQHAEDLDLRLGYST